MKDIEKIGGGIKDAETVEVVKDIVFDGKFWIDKNGVKHRYVNPLLDEGFKILFGSEGNEDLL